MKLFADFALVCPGFILISWAILLLFKKKTPSQQILHLTVFVCAIYFTCDAVLTAPERDYTAITIARFLQQIVGIAMLPILVGYYRSLSGKKPFHWGGAVWFLISVIQITISVMLLVINGLPKSIALTKALITGEGLEAFTQPSFIIAGKFCNTTFSVLLLAAMVYTVVNAIISYRQHQFTFQDFKNAWEGKSARRLAFMLPATIVLMGICLIRRLLGHEFLHEHLLIASILAIALSIVIQQLCFEGCRELRDVSEDISEEDFSRKCDNMSGKACEPSMSNELLDRLHSDFCKEMDTNKHYLDPTISVDKIASILLSNKTYTSRMVNMKFGMTFREYINQRRIAYAKELLLEHPDATIEFISSQCGFMSASAFIKKFQQYEDKAPRLWALHNTK